MMTTVAQVEYNLRANTRGLRAARQQLERFAQVAERAGKQVDALARQNLAGGLQRQGQAAQRSAQQTSRLAQQTARVAAQMRSGNSQVDVLVRGLTSTDKATQRAARSQKTLLSTLGGSNRAVAQQAQALARLSQAQAQGVVTTRQAAEHQRLISRRFTTTAVNSRDLRLNMRGLNASMDQLATVAATAGGPVGQLGAQVGMLGGMLRGVNPLFAAGAAALAGAGGIATAANRAAQQIDALNNRAQAAGMAVEQYDALVFTFTQLAGVTENEANNALRRYSRRVGDARDGTGRLADELKAAGVRLNEFLRQSPEQQMRTLARAMSQVEDAQQRASLAAAAFGAENVQLGLAFSQGEGALTSYMEKAERLGLVNQEQAETAGEVLAAQDELRRAVRELSFTLVEQFGPALARAADELRGILAIMGDVSDMSRLINDRMQHMAPEIGLPVNRLQAAAETIENARERIAAAQAEMDGGVGLRRRTQLQAIIRQENAEIERAVEHRQRLLASYEAPDSVLTQRFIFAQPQAPTGAPGTGGEGGGDTDPAAEMVQRLEDQNAVLRRQQQLQDANEEQRKVAVAVLEAEQELRREGVDLSSEQARRALELTAQVERQRL
ncbi:hypothetical protein QWY84_11075, partial [Aquisalimonas lutea]|uniref:hypothetical protein n=1 Tax=Aquisalimonas lutea TaxID=1327750 RepID=UPI0025B3A549